MDVLADAYPPLGRHDRTAAVLAEMLDNALTSADRRRELVIRLRQARIRLDTDAKDVAAIRAEAEHAVEEFAAAGDDAGVAQAAYLLAQVHRMVGASRQVAEVARSGLPHADRSGLVRTEIGLRYALSWATQAGETPAPEAIRRCEQLAWRNGVLHPPVLCDVAVLRAMRGEPSAARDLVADVREHLVERMRVRRPLMFVARYAGEVAMLAGDHAAAEHELRTTLQMALDMGEQDYLAQTAAELSRVLAVRGRVEEADRLASLAEDHAPAASVAQVQWRAAKARVLVHAGRPGEAVPLARDAADLAPEEMPNLRADALVELADVLRASGRQDAATAVIDEAVERYEAKGNLVSAARIRTLRRP